jgi:hypothetical protein
VLNEFGAKETNTEARALQEFKLARLVHTKETALTKD